MSLPAWNLEFERGLEVGALRKAVKSLFVASLEQDTAAILVVRWWMRPTVESRTALLDHLVEITGISRSRHRMLKNNGSSVK